MRGRFCGLLIGAGNIGRGSFFSTQIGLPYYGGSAGADSVQYPSAKEQRALSGTRILKVKDYFLAVVISMLLYAVMMAGSTLFPIYIQTVCQRSAAVSGLIMMPGSLIMAVISPFAGRFFDRFGIRRLVVWGSALQMISCLGVVFVNESTPALYIAAVYIVRLISIGLIMMPIVTWGMMRLGPEKTAHGTALLTSLRTISGAFGSAIFVAVMTGVTGMTSGSLEVTANAAA